MKDGKLNPLHRFGFKSRHRMSRNILLSALELLTSNPVIESFRSVLANRKGSISVVCHVSQIM